MKNLFSKEFITYCLVGVANTLVGTSTAFICLDIFLFSYGLSVVFSYITGIIVSFVLNKKYTFKNKDKSLSQFVKFFMVMLPSFVFSYFSGYYIAHFSYKIFQSFYEILHNITNIPQLMLVDNFAVLISLVLHLIIGFSVNKFFVFKKKSE